MFHEWGVNNEIEKMQYNLYRLIIKGKLRSSRIFKKLFFEGVILTQERIEHIWVIEKLIDEKSKICEDESRVYLFLKEY